MPKTLPNGFLIIFDGIDGVGKTTQLSMVQTGLKKAGWPVIDRRNLGGTPIGEELRKVIKTMSPRPTETNLYISAAIQAALIEQITADKKAGKLILMDRGPISLAAYEIFGSGLDETLGWQHVDEGMRGLNPDLTIIYRAEVAKSLERAKNQSTKVDYFESKPLNYFERVAKGYEIAARRYEDVVIIDAERSIDSINKQTMKIINDSLAKFS